MKNFYGQNVVPPHIAHLFEYPTNDDGVLDENSGRCYCSAIIFFFAVNILLDEGGAVFPFKVLDGGSVQLR